MSGTPGPASPAESSSDAVVRAAIGHAARGLGHARRLAAVFHAAGLAGPAQIIRAVARELDEAVLSPRVAELPPRLAGFVALFAAPTENDPAPEAIGPQLLALATEIARTDRLLGAAGHDTDDPARASLAWCAARIEVLVRELARIAAAYAAYAPWDEASCAT